MTDAIAKICERLSITLASEIGCMPSGVVTVRVYIREGKVNGWNEDIDESSLRIPAATTYTNKQVCGELKTIISRDIRHIYNGETGLRVLVRDGKIGGYGRLKSVRYKL